MSLQSLLTTPYTGLVYASYSTLYIYPHSLITRRLRLAFPSSSLNSLLFDFQFFFSSSHPISGGHCFPVDWLRSSRPHRDRPAQRHKNRSAVEPLVTLVGL